MFQKINKKIFSGLKVYGTVFKMHKNSTIFYLTNFPGEVISMDIDKKYKIAIAIDYFLRIISGKWFDNKNPEKLLKFATKVNNKLKIHTILSDNGKDFKNVKQRNLREKIILLGNCLSNIIINRMKESKER